MESLEIMKRAINTYGVQAQCDVCVEEMAELTQALMKTRRADDYNECALLDSVLEEIADVEIMVEQMKLIWGAASVAEWREIKLKRLEARLNGSD